MKGRYLELSAICPDLGKMNFACLDRFLQPSSLHPLRKKLYDYLTVTRCTHSLTKAIEDFGKDVDIYQLDIEKRELWVHFGAVPAVCELLALPCLKLPEVQSPLGVVKSSSEQGLTRALHVCKKTVKDLTRKAVRSSPASVEEELQLTLDLCSHEEMAAILQLVRNVIKVEERSA